MLYGLLMSEVGRLVLIAGSIVGALLTASIVLIGAVTSPIAVGAIFLCAVAGSVFGLNNYIDARFDRADCIGDQEEVQQLLAAERQRQHEQVVAPQQHVNHFIQREIQAGNPMWAFLAPKPIQAKVKKSPAAKSRKNPETLADSYQVGGYNLRKRKVH